MSGLLAWGERISIGSTNMVRPPVQGGGGRHQGHVSQEAGEAAKIRVQARPVRPLGTGRTKSIAEGMSDLKGTVQRDFNYVF